MQLVDADTPQSAHRPRYVDATYATLPQQIISNVSKAFQVDDPIITQSLLSFSLTSEDHWKLESWKVLFAAASVVYSDFSFTLNEVQLLGNRVLKELQMLYIMPTQTVCDVAQALLNTRHLLRRDSVVRHVFDAWDLDARRKFHFRRANEPLCSVEVPSGVQTMSSVYRAVASGAAFLFSGLSKVFDSRSEDHHGGHTAERNTVMEERHLPFPEPLTQQSPGEHFEVLHVRTLEDLAEAFLSTVNSRMSSNSPSSREVTGVISNTVVAENQTSTIVLFSSIAAFLSSRIRVDVTVEDTLIFVWFLTFFSRRCRCQPFDYSIETTPETRDVAGKIGVGGKPIQVTEECLGLKIVWDSLEQDQSKKRQHVCVAEDSNVTPEDHVRLLEVYAQSVLSERIKVCEIKVSAAEAECRKLLKLQRREGALLWLKKKKLFEKEIEGLESQLLRLDEAQHMRDAFRAVGLVASVLQASIATTRSNLGEASRVAADAKQSLEQSNLDMEEVRQLFDQLSFAEPAADQSLEDEYAKLLATEQLETTLETLPVPQHPLPSAPEVKEANAQEARDPLPAI